MPIENEEIPSDSTYLDTLKLRGVFEENEIPIPVDSAIIRYDKNGNDTHTKVWASGNILTIQYPKNGSFYDMDIIVIAAGGIQLKPARFGRDRFGHRFLRVPNLFEAPYFTHKFTWHPHLNEKWEKDVLLSYPEDSTLILRLGEFLKASPRIRFVLLGTYHSGSTNPEFSQKVYKPRQHVREVWEKLRSMGVEEAQIGLEPFDYNLKPGEATPEGIKWDQIRKTKGTILKIDFYLQFQEDREFDSEK